jgi:hypothetical protein
MCGNSNSTRSCVFSAVSLIKLQTKSHKNSKDYRKKPNIKIKLISKITNSHLSSYRNQAHSHHPHYYSSENWKQHIKATRELGGLRKLTCSSSSSCNELVKKYKGLVLFYMTSSRRKNKSVDAVRKDFFLFFNKLLGSAKVLLEKGT